ncbi:MAG: cell division protein FtsA [Bacteroidales bacterium]|nr:cell division protein FtsA [Bacteroidales bacterium]MCF8454337.1 cell division protein FtsA [Bacteroidales bacterium]
MMTQNNEYMAAIDIGTSETIAIIGEKTAKGKLNIVGLGATPSVGVKRGVVVNIEETANSIKLAVDQATEMAHFKLSRVFVGIAGQHIKSVVNKGKKFIDAPEYEIKQNDVNAIKADMYKIPIEASEEIIHVIPQNYSVDNEGGVKNPVGISGKQLEANYLIVIGQSASARNIEKCVNRIGLDIIDLILSPLAAAEAVLTEDEKEAGVVLVDIGGGTTDLAIYYDNVIRHTAIIPFGGTVVTNDIKEGCATLLRQAEALKLQYGCALGEVADENKIISIPGISGRPAKEISFRNLAFIIQSRMEEIVDAVLFEIQNSGMSDKISAGLVLTGGSALLNNLPDLFTLQTGYDVRIGYPSEILSDNTPEEMSNPKFATAIGLLLKGFEHPKAKDVLIPKLETPVAVDKIEEEEEEEEPSGGIFRSIKKHLKNLVEDKDLN